MTDSQAPPSVPEWVPEPLKLRKIVSGGQTGADRAGLDAAKTLGLETGGYAPHNFVTECGPCPELGTRYGLVAMARMSERAMYPIRSQKNVDIADATVVFRFFASVGSDKTIGYCRTGKWQLCDRPVCKPRCMTVRGVSTSDASVSHKPVHVVERFDEETRRNFRQWLLDNCVHTLNVAGHRSSSVRFVADYEKKVHDFIVSAVSCGV